MPLEIENLTDIFDVSKNRDSRLDVAGNHEYRQMQDLICNVQF